MKVRNAPQVWKCLHDKAPRCLADLCIPVTSVDGRRQLRSATTETLLLPRAQTSTGQRSFVVFGLATWNSLPLSLRTPNCRWAPLSAGWRLSFSSTRETSSGAVVTDQRVRRRTQIFSPNSTQLSEADNEFLRRVTSNSNHILHPYLPGKTNIPYQLRTRSHRITLTNKTKFLNDTDFIIRLLYKHSFRSQMNAFT